MQRRNGNLLFSPSDLNHFLECEHLTALDLAVVRGELARPALDDPQRELIARKGDEHEARFLASLRAADKSIATIELGDGSWDLERGAADTLAAMRSGARRLPGRLPRLRRLAWVSRLSRARRHALRPRGLQLRGRRHEARSALEAVLHPPALLLLRARQAHSGFLPCALYILGGTGLRESLYRCSPSSSLYGSY